MNIYEQLLSYASSVGKKVIQGAYGHYSPTSRTVRVEICDVIGFKHNENVAFYRVDAAIDGKKIILALGACLKGIEVDSFEIGQLLIIKIENRTIVGCELYNKDHFWFKFFQMAKEYSQRQIIEKERIAKEQKIVNQVVQKYDKEGSEKKLQQLLKKKQNWQDIAEIFYENGISALYHFTDIKNLKSISESNGLFSWQYAESNGIIIPRPGGGNLSRRLDERYGLSDYVRVSFCPDHPMKHRLKQEGFKLVLLEIDLEVAYFENTLFSNTNATDSDHKMGGNIEDVKRIKFLATKKRFLRADDPDFRYHQAEILVKSWIPSAYIKNINNYI